MKLGHRALWLPFIVAGVLTALFGACGVVLVRDTIAAHARALENQLLEEGGAAALSLGRAFLQSMENRLGGQINQGPERTLAMIAAGDDARGHLVVYDFSGKVLNADADPAIAALLDADKIDVRRSLKQLEDEKDFSADNYQRYALGKDPVPARAYYRIYDSLGWVIGYGVAQHTTAARLEAARANMEADLYRQTLIMGIAAAIAVLLALLLAWWLTRQWIARPLALLTGNAVLPARGGARPRGIAGDVARAQESMQTLRAEAETLGARLNTEQQARLGAEEERDRWRTDFQRKIATRELEIGESMKAQLRDERHAILRRAERVARCLAGDAGVESSRSIEAWKRYRSASTGSVQAAGEAVAVDSWVREMVAAYDAAEVRTTVLNLQSNGAASIDSEALQTALYCLLDNAWQAVANKPGGRVSVNTAMAGEGVEIRVVDNGPGIGEVERGHVFEAFYSTREEAAGLGLTVAQRIVEKLGAAIHIHVEQDKGTAVVLLVPVKS